MSLSRRDFLKACVMGLGGLNIAVTGFDKALAYNGNDEYPEVVHTTEGFSYIFRNDPNVVKSGPLYFYQIANGMWSFNLSTYKATIEQFSKPGIRGYINEAHPNEVPGFLEGDVSGYYKVWQADEDAPKLDMGWYYYYPIDNTMPEKRHI